APPPGVASPTPPVMMPVPGSRPPEDCRVCAAGAETSKAIAAATASAVRPRPGMGVAAILRPQAAAGVKPGFDRGSTGVKPGSNHLAVSTTLRGRKVV